MSPRLLVERNGAQVLEGSWLYGMRGLSVVRSYWEAKVASMAVAESERKAGLELEASGNNAMYDFGIPALEHVDTQEFGAMNLDNLDEAWIRDILGGYDFHL